MKKVLSLVGLAIFSLSNAHAEDRLFPTDILDKGKVDIRLTVRHDTNSANVSFNGMMGRTSSKSTLENLQARYGIGSKWHIGLALPYASQSVTDTDYNNPSAHFSSNRAQGGQNPSIWATYGLISDKTSAFSLNAELVISPDTTGDLKTSYTGRLISGWTISDTLRPYASVAVRTYNNSDLADTYTITIGSNVKLSETLTLVPYVSHVQYASTNNFSAFDQESVTLSANVKFAPNLYLIPSFAFYRNGAHRSDDGLFRRNKTDNGRNMSLSAYYLF